MEEDEQMAFTFNDEESPPEKHGQQSEEFRRVSEQIPDPDTFFAMQLYDLDQLYHFVLSQIERKEVFTTEQRRYLTHYLWLVEDHLLDLGAM